MTTFAKELSDMMASFDSARAKWIEKFGSDEGFNEWLINETKARKTI